MPFTRSSLSSGVLAVMVGAGLTVGISEAQQENPAAIDAILACRSIAEDTRRLACMDEASSRLAGAIDRQDIVVVERDQAIASERDSFGLAFANPARVLASIVGRSATEGRESGLQLYGDGAEAIRNESGEIEVLRGLPVRDIRHDHNNRLVVTLQNGQVWRQTDARRVPIPRPGTPVTLEISRGALGSYFMQASHNSYRMRARRD